MVEVRVLCGAYVPSSPFIEGGCASDWVESFDGPRPICCPGCGRECGRDWIDWALDLLATRVVCVLGCPHRAMTFSRRLREPYFSADETAAEAPGWAGAFDEYP